MTKARTTLPWDDLEHLAWINIVPNMFIILHMHAYPEVEAVSTRCGLESFFGESVTQHGLSKIDIETHWAVLSVQVIDSSLRSTYATLMAL